MSFDGGLDALVRLDPDAVQEAAGVLQAAGTGLATTASVLGAERASGTICCEVTES